MAEIQMFQPGTAFMNSYNQAKAGSLAKIAFTEPQRRQSALADLYGLDPQAANSMKKEFDAQEQEQLKTFATAFVNAPDDNMRSQMYARAKEMWRPRFHALGSDIPDDWRQAMPTIKAIAGITPQQAPAKVLEAQYFAKEMGLDKDPKAYAAYMRKVSGFDGDPAEIKIHPTTGTMYQQKPNGVDVYDWNTGKWNFIPGPGQTSQTPPSQSGEFMGTPTTVQTDNEAPVDFSTLPASEQQALTMASDAARQGKPFHYTVRGGAVINAQGQPSAPAVGGAPSAPPQSPNNPFAKKGYQMATAEQKAAFGIPPDVPAQIGPDGKIDPISLPGGDKSASIANETTIRKEFAAQVKPYQDVISAYKRVETAASSPTAAGDLSMIFAYMKMLDPGSVVREGEFANAQNAAGVPDQVLNLYNRIRTGQRLNPQQRADFLKQARGLKTNAETSYKEYERQYAEIAKQYEIPVERIIVGPSVTPRGGTIDLNSPDPLGILK